MAVWTSLRDQRLLLLLLDDLKPNAQKIAAAWREKYALMDDYMPTPRAITEHFVTLRKSTGLSASQTTPKAPRVSGAKSSPSSNKTAKARSNTTTPTKGGKRKRSAFSDDDEMDVNVEDENDDSEEDSKLSKPQSGPPRVSLRRNAKVARKAYMEDSDEVDVADELDEGFYDQAERAEETAVTDNLNIPATAPGDIGETIAVKCRSFVPLAPVEKSPVPSDPKVKMTPLAAYLKQSPQKSGEKDDDEWSNGSNFSDRFRD